MLNLIYCLIYATLIALLGGCAGNSVNPTTALTELQKKAVIVLSVSHDNAAEDGANAIFYLDIDRYPGRVILKSVQDSLPFAAKSDFSSRRGHLYILEVSPGSHTIDAWQVASAGLRISTKISPIRFSIEPGEILYLGNFHTQLVLGHTLLSGGRAARGAIPYIVDQRSEDIALAESRVPALKNRTKISLLPLGPIPANGETSRWLDPIPVPIIPRK